MQLAALVGPSADNDPVDTSLEEEDGLDRREVNSARAVRRRLETRAGHRFFGQPYLNGEWT